MQASTASVYRHYDTRIKAFVPLSRNPKLFPELKIPRSTARYWARSSRLRLITGSDIPSPREAELFAQTAKLEKEVRRLTALLALHKTVSNLAGHTLSWKRFPAEQQKRALLSAIDQAHASAPLSECLAVVELSQSRFTAWRKRKLQCLLKDKSACPRLMPQQLTQEEVGTMRTLYHDPALAHLSLASLCLYGQRTGELFCSPWTWRKYAHALNWKRERLRVYPAKKRLGVRALAPNHIWHIDVTHIRLADGQKRYLQAVIDNCSRYVLAWRVSDHVGGLGTKRTIRLALKEAQRLGQSSVPNLYSDGGFENVNSRVRQLVRRGRVTHTVAQFDVSFSNSMIEALFNALKNRYLYQRQLVSSETLESAVAFYFNDHNHRIPQQVLGGATPAEIFAGAWTTHAKQALKAQTHSARIHRIIHNRKELCAACA